MIARIPLYGRGGVRAYAIVDPADHDELARWRWHLSVRGYAFRNGERNGRRTTIMMHREIAGGDSPQVDHRNRNRLDNRRANLRPAVNAQNAQNVPGRVGTSRFRGVSRSRRRWRATVRLAYKQHHVGLFDTEEAAASAAAAFRALHMPFSADALAVAS